MTPYRLAGEAIRTAPGRTARPARARESYSTLRVTVPVVGSMLSTPRQLPQPPVCGEPEGARARFHSSTLRAQLRVAPMASVPVLQPRLVPKSGAQPPPEHSVNQMPLSG